MEKIELKIVILIEHAHFGGHCLSALTTARELKKRGHELTVVTGQGPLASEIRKEFRHYTISFYPYFGKRQTDFSLDSCKTIKALSTIKEMEDCDIIHAFDVRSYYVASLFNVFVRTVPVACTICGGVAPYSNIPKLGKLIVFSLEQKQKMLNMFKWDEPNVECIRTRMDMGQFNVGDSEIDALCSKFNIDPDGKNIMMITTFLEPKVKSICQTLEAMDSILKKKSDYQFILIGGKGEFYNEAISLGNRINEKLGRHAVHFTGLVPGAYRLLKRAYIVLGQGRSAFEGMSFQKPTIIVGENGFAGTVSDNNIEEISYYNFSGRNQKSLENAQTLENELARLIEDNKYYENVRYYGRTFVEKNIAIHAGVERIEAVYRYNIRYFKSASSITNFLKIIKPLLPVLVDNYYNYVKLSVLKVA